MTSRRLAKAHKPMGREDGFSLIEMLVTLCVVALLAGVMLAGLSQFGRMREIARTVAAEQELDVTTGYLAELIHNSQSLPLLDEEKMRTPMIGTADNLRLVSQARIASDRHGLRDVEIILLREDGHLSVVERHRARRALDTQVEDAFPVLDNVASLAFSYLARSEEGELSWQDHWVDQRRPLAVKIRIAVIRNGHSLEHERTVFLPP